MVFENRVLRMMFGPKRDDVTGEWRRLHTEKLYALYSSANIIQAIKSKRIGWVGHVAYIGDRELHTGFWWGDVMERDHLEDIGVDGRIMLK
jgi:hypothetical protein